MVSVHGYNKERVEKGFVDTYVLVIIFGVVGAVFLILGIKGIILLFKVSIKYWIWFMILMFGIIFSKRIFFKRRQR